MNDIIALQQKIAPELIELIERRYTILRHVSYSQPVGRRSLAAHLKMGERIARSELEFLKNQGLLCGDGSGVKLTAEGEELIRQLSDFVKQMRGLNEIELNLQKRLKLQRVVVVPGDSDQDGVVKKELGRATVRYLLEILHGGEVIAVTGGTTVGAVAEVIPVSHVPRNTLVVPARGGLGENVESQANTIAAKIAKKMGAPYRLLHVPDNIAEDAMQSLSRDPHIAEITETIKSANILIHGIGNAEELSISRGDPPEETEGLMKCGAVGEAFGHYFAKDGEIVKTIHSLGIRIHDLERIEHVIGVAGGSQKADAILSVILNGHETVLITDEAAGCAILRQVDRLSNVGEAPRED